MEPAGGQKVARHALFCEECEAKIESASKFCDACGAKLEDAEQSQVKPPSRAPLSDGLIGASNSASFHPTTGERTVPVTGTSKSGTFILGFLIGGIVGVILVRAFFLPGLEEFGWRLFWEGFGVVG